MPRRGPLYNALSGTKSDYDNMPVPPWQDNESLGAFEPMVKNPLGKTHQRIYDQKMADEAFGRQSMYEQQLREFALDPQAQFEAEGERQRQIRMNRRQHFEPWRQHE